MFCNDSLNWVGLGLSAEREGGLTINEVGQRSHNSTRDKRGSEIANRQHSDKLISKRALLLIFMRHLEGCNALSPSRKSSTVFDAFSPQCCVW